ncbi:PH domain-containing protein [Geomicrobium sediminis]|uniref:Uncharacterized protein YyaB-like PH domain-containing protein n=1 Tax=Geomicrobium sediminis TaxID=1347788 RepID=A0ABS2PFP9_9BACL|nr:PH domain-containing protein [Geomicrobium sediminis]MBM7634254.1 hypothetical protein [Geomicrobium sediminis]
MIKYELHKETFIARAGFFKIEIAYDNIYKVNRVNGLDLSSGALKMALAGDGLDIHYKYGFGSVTISPKEDEIFVKELSTRTNKATFSLENMN